MKLSRADRLPKVKIVDGSLLIAHVDVEREEVDWRKSTPSQDLKKGWQTVALVVWLWRRGSVLCDRTDWRRAVAVVAHDGELVDPMKLV